MADGGSCRPTIASALEPEDFWPGYQSHVPGCTRTVPELVFEANDEDGPLHVVVEVKTGFGTHRQEQLAREVVDTAHGERAIRIALIAIGADLGAAGGAGVASGRQRRPR